MRMVLCSPVAGTLYVAPGSKPASCSRCKAQVWFSPETAARVAGEPYELICFACLAKFNDEITIEPPTAAELATVAKMFAQKKTPPYQ